VLKEKKELYEMLTSRNKIVRDESGKTWEGLLKARGILDTKSSDLKTCEDKVRAISTEVNVVQTAANNANVSYFEMRELVAGKTLELSSRDLMDEAKIQADAAKRNLDSALSLVTKVQEEMKYFLPEKQSV